MALFEQDREKNLLYNLIPNKNKVILQDRYYFSTAAYQGISEENVKEILYYFFNKFPPPKIVFFLDIEIPIALERIKKRKQTFQSSLDIFEKEIELTRIRNNYKIIWEELKKLRIEFYILDAQKKITELTHFIIRKIFSTIQ